MPDTTDRARRPGAVLLAGGRARRLGAVDKPALAVGVRTLLDRLLDAVGAWPVVVVGQTEAGRSRAGVRFTQEEPAYGGPVAAIAAGLALLDPEIDPVVVLAGDQPFVTNDLLQQLCSAIQPDAPLAVVSRDGRAQWLTAAWHGPTLRSRIAALHNPAGVSVRALIGGLPLTLVEDPAPGGRPLSFDVDTPDDLEQARKWADER